MSECYVAEIRESVLVNHREPFEGKLLEKCHYALYEDNYRAGDDSWHSMREYNFDEMVSEDYFVFKYETGDGPCVLEVLKDGTIRERSELEGTIVRSHSQGDPVFNIYKDYLSFKGSDDSDD